MRLGMYLLRMSAIGADIVVAFADLGSAASAGS